MWLRCGPVWLFNRTFGFESMKKSVKLKNVDPKELIQRDPILRKTMAEIFNIQPRYSPEPVFGPTGKGYLRSEGTSKFQRVKKRRSKK